MTITHSSAVALVMVSLIAAVPAGTASAHTHTAGVSSSSAVVACSGFASFSFNRGVSYTRGSSKAVWNSPNCTVRAVFQGDGNLVVYRGGRAVWSTGTHGRGWSLSFQGDGNLVLYSRAGRALWNSGTPGHTGPKTFTLSDSGRMYLATRNGRYWSS